MSLRLDSSVLDDLGPARNVHYYPNGCLAGRSAHWLVCQLVQSGDEIGGLKRLTY